jgi:hypothetical protein
MPPLYPLAKLREEGHEIPGGSAVVSPTGQMVILIDVQHRTFDEIYEMAGWPEVPYGLPRLRCCGFPHYPSGLPSLNVPLVPAVPPRLHGFLHS